MTNLPLTARRVEVCLAEVDEQMYHHRLSSEAAVQHSILQNDRRSTTSDHYLCTLLATVCFEKMVPERLWTNRKITVNAQASIKAAVSLLTHELLYV